MKDTNETTTKPTKTYTCVMCERTFTMVEDENWSEEKAKNELKENFGDVPIEECAAVCDDCYEHFKP